MTITINANINIFVTEELNTDSEYVLQAIKDLYNIQDYIQLSHDENKMKELICFPSKIKVMSLSQKTIDNDQVKKEVLEKIDKENLWFKDLILFS